MRRTFPMRPGDHSVTARTAIATGAVVNVADVLRRAGNQLRRSAARTANFRAALGVPMLREGQCIGAIVVGRAAVGEFGSQEVELLTTFADQAVIAIENVRLFNETKEALERQTATADILRVISDSPTDVTPVFDAIAERARVLCGALLGFTTRFDGEMLHLIGYHGVSADTEAIMRASFPRKPDPASINGRCFLAKAPVQITDVWDEPGYQLGHIAKAAGYRSMLAVPMLQGSQAIGVIGVARPEPGEFPGKLVALLQTFADQAVIAIQNVRLFNETQEALEQQKATAEILSVISNSVSDTKPVFDKILDSCLHLFGTEQIGIFLADDEGVVHSAAWHGDALESIRRNFPRPVGDTITGRVMRDRRCLRISSAAAMADAPPTIRDVQLLIGDYSAVFAPMLREDRGIGSIMLMRQPPKPFSDKEIALLETFADQAVIAIQNARLFNETQVALERQTATAEVLQVISGSVADTAPVFDKILECCERLLPAASFQLHLVDETGRLTLERLRWTDQARAEVDATRARPVRGRRVRTVYPMPLAETAAAMAFSSAGSGRVPRCAQRSRRAPSMRAGRAAPRPNVRVADRAADVGGPRHRRDRRDAGRGGTFGAEGARAARRPSPTRR